MTFSWVNRKHAAQTPLAITEGAGYGIALELEVSLNQASLNISTTKGTLKA